MLSRVQVTGCGSVNEFAALPETIDATILLIGKTLRGHILPVRRVVGIVSLFPAWLRSPSSFGRTIL